MPMPKKPRRNCKHCGQPVNFVESVYCSNKCQKEFQYQDYIERWKQGLESGTIAECVVSHHVRRYVLERDGEQCSECSWNRRHPVTGKVPLEIHHLNGDHLDNSEANLVLLCPNCHSLTPTYRALNKGNGRVKRRKMLAR